MLRTIKKYKAPYLFILPFFILFFVFQLIPTIWTVYISLTNWKGIGSPEFCGFGNYQKMMVDDMFWESLGNTVVYWLSGLILIICCALLIACLLNSRYLQKDSVRSFFKTATFLPNICAAIAMGLIFRMLFDENVGLINEVISMVGGSKIPWLTSTTYSKIPVINAAQQFWFITLPSLKNILFFCSVTLTVDMWKLFNESYILPGPGTSNSSLFQYMYESGFNVFNMGYASAIGVVLILILMVISIIQFAVRRKQGEL